MALNMFYFTQSAEDLFDPVAGLTDPGVMESFRKGLVHARFHLVEALTLAQPGGIHEDLCYHFQVASCLLTAWLDGIAVYVEKKVAVTPAQGAVYWAANRTFIDPQFAELRAIQQTTNDHIIKGGITINTLRNLAKHYMPWSPLSSAGTGNDGGWDIRFPIDSVTKSGPVLRGLMFHVFNDAVDAYEAFGRLMGMQVTQVLKL